LNRARREPVRPRRDLAKSCNLHAIFVPATTLLRPWRQSHDNVVLDDNAASLKLREVRPAKHLVVSDETAMVVCFVTVVLEHFEHLEHSSRQRKRGANFMRGF
jgi:hypothetical protein